MSQTTEEHLEILTPNQESSWWKSAVVYQIYPRSFADSNADGIGDIPGIISKLDYLKDLGVDVIWLSPAYKSPQDDNGYDISDYQDIDPMFGELKDLDELISGLHDRGMKLVMDLVVNHTSDEHPWFQESKSSKENPKRDWYIWRPARPGTVAGEPGSEPNNWGSIFSGPAWKYDEETGEYYLHLFSVKQPDLNWDNPEVRQAVIEMMKWWIARGVDGFRMDVINFISKTPGLPDGETYPGAQYGNGFPYFASGPKIHEYLQEINQAVFGQDADKYLTVGEMPGATVEQAQLYTDPNRHEVNMIFQFEHMELDAGPGGKFDPVKLDFVGLKKSLANWQEGLAENGWNSLYWSNHDHPRAVSRFGDDGFYWLESAKLLATVLHLMRGTPYIYQGEEIGMTNSSFGGIDDFRDIESLNYYNQTVPSGQREAQEVLDGLRYAGRDNSRTPMQWSATENAGFSAGEPWIGVSPNYGRINVEAQLDDPNSILSHYQKLIRLRHQKEVISLGDFKMHLIEDEQVFAYTRSYGDEELLLVANFGQGPVEVDTVALGWEYGEVLVHNYPVNTPLPSTTGLHLRAWEAVAYVRTREA